MVKNKIWIPRIDQVISYNKKILDLKQATKGDSHKVLSRSKLDSVLRNVRKADGNSLRKSALLMEGLANPQTHAFASGNRRTAYFTGNKMLWKNQGFAMLKREGKRAEFMNKIRRGELSIEQIERELKNE